MNNKRGSSAIFLSVILGTLVSISLVLIFSIKEQSVRSTSEGLINLAGESLLSEFDYNIQKEYGLFMRKGSDRDLTRCFNKYMNYSIAEMKDVKSYKAKISGGRYNLSDTELATEEILEYAKLAKLKGVLGDVVGDKVRKENNLQERSLKHGGTIDSLPSNGIPKRNMIQVLGGIVGKLGEIENALKEGSESYLINSYIFSNFNNTDEKVSDKHFFKNEVEYIIAGEFTDEKNNREVGGYLKAMRVPLNMLHLQKDPAKKAALLTAAEIITPGPGAAATEKALTLAWAYWEADNDVELLRRGHKVPLLKDEQTWATDLDAVIAERDDGVIMPSVEKGERYKYYLQILLQFHDRGTKTARILDLIQINHRAEYNKEFTINEYFTGIDILVTINNKKYEYEKQY